MYQEGHEFAKKFAIPPSQSVADFVNFFKLKAFIDEGLPFCGNLEPNTKVFVGSVEAMYTNAWVTMVNAEGEYLIVLNSGLLNALSSITNLLAHKSTNDSPATEESVSKFVAMVKKYAFFLETEDYHTLPLEWDTEPEKLWLATDVMCKAFVLAHEYSHILLGHLCDAERLEKINWATGVGALRANKAKELAADVLAFQLVTFMHPNRSRHDVRRVEGAWMTAVTFFETVRMFDRARQMAGIDTETTTHPEPRERVDAILTFVRSKTGSWELFSHLQYLEGLIRNAITELWIRAEMDIATCVRENGSTIREIHHGIRAVSV